MGASKEQPASRSVPVQNLKVHDIVRLSRNDVLVVITGIKEDRVEVMHLGGRHKNYPDGAGVRDGMAYVQPLEKEEIEEMLAEARAKMNEHKIVSPKYGEAYDIAYHCKKALRPPSVGDLTTEKVVYG